MLESGDLVGDRTSKARLESVRITETQFADDAALYASSRDELEEVARSFVGTAQQWGLTVSLSKTKGMACGSSLENVDHCSIQLEEGCLEMVDGFLYLGSFLSRDGNTSEEVARRISRAAKAFGALKFPIFRNQDLSLSTKRKVYSAVVLPTLLYGAETWPVKAQDMTRLNSFHMGCIRSILGVSKHDQWTQGISYNDMRERLGMEEGIVHSMMERRLRWLGHVARMASERIPVQMLFGELMKTRPCRKPKRRWRDIVMADLKAVKLEDDWFALAQDRRTWRSRCKDGLMALVDQPVPHRSSSAVVAPNAVEREYVYHCPCGRSFWRTGDRKRHQRFCNTFGGSTGI